MTEDTPPHDASGGDRGVGASPAATSAPEGSWYRELLVAAAIIGVVIPLLCMVFLGVTGAASDLIFGDQRLEAWSGEWWWIPYTAVGGLVITFLRGWWDAQEHIPGGVAIVESGVVDHRVAPAWLGITTVSLVAGASLGPSFGFIMMGGGLASWIASRRWPGNEEARLMATTTGIAGALGGAFTSPLLGAIMVTELAPMPHPRYSRAIMAQLIAATVAFGIFFGVVGATLLDSFAVPVDDFEPWQLLVGVALGVASCVIMITFALIVKSVNWLADKVTHRYVRGVVAGALVGCLTFALPLTMGSGNSQLTAVVENSATLSVGLLLAVLVGKMVAMALSLAAGFIGGNVIPMLFVGGTAGVVVHLLFPDIPFAIAVGCMLSAVPGAYIKAPLGLTAIAALSIGLGPVTTAPVVVAVVTSYLLTSAILAKLRARVTVPPLHA